MTAVVYQIRDYQSKKDRERMQAELERQAVQIANEAFPSVFGISAGIDAITNHNEMILDRVRGIPANVERPCVMVTGSPVNYTAPDKDPA